MDYASLQEAERDYNRKLEIDYENVLKGTARHPDPDELRARLVKFLRNNAIGTLATCSEDLPRATPVRYKSEDLHEIKGHYGSEIESLLHYTFGDEVVHCDHMVLIQQ